MSGWFYGGFNRVMLLVTSLIIFSACGGGGGGGTAPAPTLPSVSIADASVAEGDSGSTDLNFTVTLSGAASSTVTVDYATSDGSATTADGDYTSTSGTLTIPAGQTSGTISVPVQGDIAYEADETLTVTLSNPSGATLGTSIATGTITNDDALTVSIADASVAEGDSGTVTLSFIVALNGQAASDVTVEYTTSDGSGANRATTADSDYTAASGTLLISSGNTSGTINVTVNGDTIPESDETLTVTLSNPSGSGAVLGTSTATGTITNDDTFGRLNDTGITTWGDASANNLTSAQASFPGQDADYGRDVDGATNSSGDGRAGFSFTQLDVNGNTMSSKSTNYGTTPWYCVRDNVTGLIWEVKTPSGSGDLHDSSSTYTWYNPTGSNDGGDPGTSDGGTCTVVNTCDTEKFVAAVNAANFCGYSDWRLPTRDELATLVDSSYEAYNTDGQTIDPGYFPNVVAGDYWTASPKSDGSTNAWSVYFNDGKIVDTGKDVASHVRLVRGGS